jgi:hypothetical protein
MLLKELIMKKQLSLLALGLFAAGGVFATPFPAPSHDEVNISGYSVQKAYIEHSTVNNKAIGKDSVASQNISSNAGDVDISGKSRQTTSIKHSDVVNKAVGKDSVAIQSMSSNVGDVDISGKSEQFTTVKHSHVGNYALGKHTRAVQSIATNTSCSGCK